MKYVVDAEKERLKAVDQFKHFNFDLNTNLQAILKLTSYLFETPVAFITLIDEHEQLFKVTSGFDITTMPRETSFCTHAISTNNVMVVSDAVSDERFSGNPLVKNPPNVRFYAGAALCSNDGHNIGTLCVLDTVVKTITEEKKVMLDILAKQVMHLMELELSYKLLNEKLEQIELRNNVLMDIAHIQSHEFRGPLSTILGLMNIIRDNDYESPKEYLLMMEQAANKLDEKIHVVVRSTELAQSTYIS